MNFKIYYPVKPNHINQSFGNVSPVYTGMGLKGHNGIDFYATHGQPVYAAHDGFAFYEIDSSSGHGVVIRSDTPYDYNGQQVFFKTIYWHFCDQDKEPQFTSPIKETNPNNQGQPVKAGDLIGYADNTGVTSGDHLHFGMKIQAQNESNGAFYNLEQNNGYLGAIDPTPYFNGLYAQDIQHPIVSKYKFNVDFGTFSLRFKDVFEFQKRLIAEGCANGLFTSPTGFFGSKTLQAAATYQIAHNITPVTGYVGPKTRNALNTT